MEGFSAPVPPQEDYKERAKKIATVGEGLTSLDAEHKGTFADQRRMEKYAKMYEEQSQESFRSNEQRESLTESVSRLKEAIQNNKDWIDSRLNSLTPEDRENYLAQEEELNSRVKVAQEKMDNYKPENEPQFVTNMPVRTEITNELNDALSALNEHELSLIELSSKAN